MSTYIAPLRDISFTLEHLAGLPELATWDSFSHADPEMLYGALDEAGRFVSEVVAPTNVVGDATGCRLNDDGSVTTPQGFQEAYARFVESGWGTLPFPSAYGGQDLPWVVGIAVVELLKSANMAWSLCPMLTQSAIDALIHHGSPEQQAIYLEKLVTGEWTGTMLLTESEAGSDVGALRAKAAPVEDGTWRITGSKVFITWGEHDVADNIIHLVLARTPGAPPGTRGISLFIVPKFLVNPDGSLGKRNDIKAVSLEHKIGIHASPTCVMSMGDDGNGAVGYLIGEENRGMAYMFTMMNNARLAVGIEGLSVSERAYQQALEFAQVRRQGRAIGAPKTESSLIIEHPDIRRMLMTMKANIEAMRSLLYLTAATIDRSRHHPDEQERERYAELLALLTPVAKAWPTDRGVDMTSLGIQIHGGMGYVEETGAAQHWRDSRIAPIYEGTNGIQAIDLVLRKVPMRGGEVVREFLAEMADLDSELEAAGDVFALIRASLTEGRSALEGATEWLLVCEDPNDALAGATPYLELFGTVTGGWLLAKGALAARRELGGAGDPFLQAKIATAHFYCTQLLPRALGLVPAVTAGAGDLFEIAPELLGA
jgi:alkylation response protein AidB-like acyl-CoA dehydrogenase